MTLTAARAAAEAFDLGGAVVGVQPFGRGLINDTFLVEIAGARAAILQRINRRVFGEPERIMQNLRTLLVHVTRRTMADPRCRELRLPVIHRARDGRDFHVDAGGGFWRALTYIENTTSLERLADAHQAGEVGYALGRFHELAHDLDPARLHVTRPAFHVTPHYLARLSAARAHADLADAAVRDCLAFVDARAATVDVLEKAKASGALPLRTVHGDPKLDNVLFDSASGRAVGLVDLDTVQPGLLHYDLGDCLRSACNPAGESPPDPAAARFDLELARAILASYLAETRGFLTAAELDYLPEAIRLIPLELGMRFLADHFDGDRYFKVEYRGHNLLRARTQFALTASVEARLDAIRATIAALGR